MSETGKKVVDLATLDSRAGANKGAVLNVLHPVTQKPIGTRITLLGTDSDAYQAFSHEQMVNKLSKAQVKGLLIEDFEDEGYELLATLTVGWEDMVVDGEEVPFTQANAKKIYKRFPWLKEQVDRFIANRANFIEG